MKNHENIYDSYVWNAKKIYKYKVGAIHREYYDSDFVYVEAQISYIIVLHDNFCFILLCFF